MTDEKKQNMDDTSQASSKSLDDSEEKSKSNTKYIIIGICIVVVVLALVILATIYLINPQNSDTTEQIRDIFIIFMAFESLIIGVALVVLIIQLSTLINLLQNEIRPIINSTSETVNTLKGTARFVSDNISEPVIKVNQWIAVVKRIFSKKSH
jgi:ABC-type spermidine/putrescine transport system permease subunit II